MRKSTLFISAVLTTFILAILFNVVNAARNNEEGVTQADPTVVAEVLPTDTPLPDPTATAVFLSPEQAATLAGQILGRTDLLSVETTLLSNENVYLVKFMNGDQVYISPGGSILSVVLAPPPVVVVSGGSNNNKGDRPPRIGGGGGGGDDDGGGGDDD
jgi:uncharacterized membrane protein YgcG